MKTINVDLAIIGGGPAGLAAAVTAKKEGIQPLIIERDFELGGILPQCIHNGFGLHVFKEELTGPEYAQRYINQVHELNISTKLNTMVIDITDNKHIIAVNQDEGVIDIAPKAIILAMGCRERTRGAIKTPGFRPAGIYTAGLAQRFVNIEGYMPGKKIVILGSGDIGLIMARRLTWEGAEVKAVVEIMPYTNGLIRNRVQCLEDFNIPLLLEHTVIKIHGKRRVEGVTIAKVDKKWKPIPGTEKLIKCDTLLLSVGLIPENELSKKVGVELDHVTGGAIVAENLETSIEGIFACGNVLQVHDLVDNVTQEAIRAGKHASDYIKQKKLEKKDLIKTIPGRNIGYIVPQLVNRESLQEQLIFFMRVKEPENNVELLIKSNSKILKKLKKKFVRPSEMIEVKTKNLEIETEINEIKFEIKLEEQK
ncbi:MAG: NAD(P)/FAD-dependent oxidoreductase [Candidatus Helarchaeota archaeon]